MSGITLFTSVPAKITRMVQGDDYGAAYQRACIQSWQAIASHIVSVNAKEEIEELERFQYPVSYLPALGARPAINELLRAAAHSSTELVAIANADCFFLGYPEFVKRILAHARAGALMLERANIEPETLMPSGRTCFGFDCFFFTRDMAAKLSVDDDLCIGQPWWDYWLPLEFMSVGGKLLRPQSPVAFHLDHQQGWSNASYLHFGRKLMRRYADGKDLPAFSESLPKFLGAAERDDLGGFDFWCFDWIRANSVLVSIADERDFGALLSRSLRRMTDYDRMHETTLLFAKSHEQLGSHPLWKGYVRYLEFALRRKDRRMARLEQHVDQLEKENARLRAVENGALKR